MIGVPIEFSSSLARLISSRLALPARTTRRMASTMPAKSSASLAPDRRRVQKYEAELLRNGFERSAGLGPVHRSEGQGRFAPGGHEAHPGGFRGLDRGMPNRLASFRLTEKDFNEAGIFVPPDCRRQRGPSQIAVNQEGCFARARGGDGQAQRNGCLAFIGGRAGHEDRVASGERRS